ncbi:hypothetical protein OS493_040655, partial [Desmophyllum pertusum]
MPNLRGTAQVYPRARKCRPREETAHSTRWRVLDFLEISMPSETFVQDRIFPQLNRICRERGTSFIPVDLRWNKTQSQQNSEHVLRMCLDSIGRCAPFFICLLGDRYGVHRAAESEVKDPATEEWLDRNFETAAACGYDWYLKRIT